MNCNVCSAPIEDGAATAKMPCCDRVSHTTCLINTIANASTFYSATIYCDCTTIIYQSPHIVENQAQHDARDQKIAELQQNENSKRDLKELKKSVTAVKRARAAYNRFLMDKKRDYTLQKKVHIDAIKALRNDARAAVRGSPTYKAINSAYAKQKALATKFKNTYGVADNVMRYMNRTMFGLHSYRLGRAYNMFLRSFRVRSF
jgi:hypothetical protein